MRKLLNLNANIAFKLTIKKYICIGFKYEK